MPDETFESAIQQSSLLYIPTGTKAASLSNMSEPIQPIQTCILSFEKMDLIDFAGPLETLSHVRGPSGDRLFSITVAGPSDEITTSQGLVIKRNICFEQAMLSLAQFDVLVVPGASYLITKELCTPDFPVIQIIQKFSTLPKHESRVHPRLLLSVCSGAFFLASTGIFAGRRATTHYTILPELAELCAKYGQTEVIRKRIVDAGLLDNGMRVVSTGGITSGFDGALYVVEVLCGLPCAEKDSDVLDYQWRRSEGLF
ncbi:uncharacterized protein Aud_002584 [Aspergillus udagawae]|uniref:DJ-1/PfpI domain-containing protein n=1 Tax=Aspergillus udagawae TaxID=91492 RepID=A0A8E0UWA0_9EURO|nr:uncharacterized protein Aud_002584 [Aspergillus udagawae]GIC86218.1 hypothetical protein Aud_002584 [Aspergillus udagawae]